MILKSKEMEPMTLGSPVGSPAAPPSSPGGTSPYLPEFLMGNDSIIGIGSTTPNSTVSPTKMIKHVTFGATPTLRSSTPASAQDRRTNREVTVALKEMEQDPSYIEEGLSIGFKDHPRRLSGKSEKTSGSGTGPPTCGLFDTLSMPSTFQPKTATDLFQQNQGVTDLSFSEASWTAEHESGNTWVTIFGFQPNAASYILSQFAHYGNIIQKKMPLKGNWIHVQYSSKIDCKKALSYNGKIFGGSIMIGVIPCRDKEIIMDMRNKENVPFHSNGILEASLGTSARQDIVNQSLLSNNSFGTPSKFNTSNISYASPEGRYANIRPLGQAYRMAQAESEISPQGAVPRKSNSVVSKAMEYVFGW